MALCLIVFGVSCTEVGSAEQAETTETATALDPAVTAVSRLRPKDLSARHGTILARPDRDGTRSINLNDYFRNESTNNFSFGEGPLFNLDGEVFAVNSHIHLEDFEHPPAGGNSQKPGELEEVSIKKGLGMAARAITLKEAKKFNLKLGKTLVIKWLDPSGSVARSGVEVNDILLEINGRPIGSIHHLSHVVSQMGSRQRVVMFVLDHRTGRTGYVQVHTP